MNRISMGHIMRLADGDRVRCQGVVALETCGEPARFCEYMPWSCDPKGVSFFYYCGACWRRVGPDGKSAEQRAKTPGKEATP